MSPGECVCVTGASGYIAAWVVKKLLEKGYTVHGTVRDPNNAEKVAHLRALPFADERLKLFKGDLLTEGSFQEAIQGCSGVLHMASPVTYAYKVDPQVELIDPAVKGTLNVLRTVAATAGVRRVVLTSSMTAVAFVPNRNENTLVDEQLWSDEDYLKDNKFFYHLSKTLAEKQAWDFAREHHIDLVTICPSLVVGEMLQPGLNFSSEVVLKFFNGENKVIPNTVNGWVSVQDVADTHILAYETASAEGRYVCTSLYAHYKEVCSHLRIMVPQAHVPVKSADDLPDMPCPKVDNSKARGLGVQFKRLEEMLLEAVESLREGGYLKDIEGK